MSASEWRRLILCEWAEGDDALTTPEDVAACIRAGSASLAPRSGFDYMAALDIGTRRDLTALVVGHAETSPAGRVVVIDRVLYWRPSPGDRGRVDLSEVEAATLRLCREYRTSRLRFDWMQAEQLTTNLAQRTCKICGETFEIVRKRGRPRDYCYRCEPVGWQVVKTPYQLEQFKLRRKRWGQPQVGPEVAARLRLVSAGRRAV